MPDVGAHAQHAADHATRIQGHHDQMGTAMQDFYTILTAVGQLMEGLNKLYNDLIMVHGALGQSVEHSRNHASGMAEIAAGG